MPTLRGELVQAHLRRLQLKLEAQSNAPRPPAKLELDPGELDFFRQQTAAENKGSSRSSTADPY